MKESPRSARAVATSSRTPAVRPARPVLRVRPRRLRLRFLGLNCPSCQETHVLDADTPTQVFDPEVHRFACPACLAVLRLLPYPSSLSEPHASQSAAEALAAAVDIVTHPLCAGIGVYDPVEGSADRDQRGVVAVYLYVPVPPVTC